MNAFSRIGQVALAEWENAVRSRRALLLFVLYFAAATCCMYGTISAFSRMERELANVLQVPAGGKTGVVSAALWKSRPFQKLVRSVVEDESTYEAVCGRHPVELVYAWFVLLCAPVLAVFVAGNRVADDLRSGAVRYMLVRVRRVEWSLGKAAGEVLMVGSALLLGALGAWTVALARLGGVDVVALLPPMLGWGVRAWLYSFAWLGLALGVSHATRSGGRATALGTLALIACAVWPAACSANAAWWNLPWLENFDALVPSSARGLLVRRDWGSLGAAAGRLVALGFLYWSWGYGLFARRDA